VIDSPSGTETKHFTHKDEFDQLYGTKASTKPQYPIDTDKTERKRQQENVSSEDEDNQLDTVALY
jgi:DNA-binding transcriptional regulator GbsR (MarR family)